MTSAVTLFALPLTTTAIREESGLFGETDGFDGYELEGGGAEMLFVGEEAMTEDA